MAKRVSMVSGVGVKPPEQGNSADGAVFATMSGVAGNVVQARDVHGGIHIQAPSQRVLPVLRQLPADTALFTGRDDELNQLISLAMHAGPGDSPGAVVISAIDGMGGIGKTALAIRAAHRLAEHFPDGQLFLDLYGFTQGAAPRDPADALATLLSSLGLPPQQIPAELEARAALYRDRLAGTRTLVLLDNAADESQVRSLLPAASTCLVLITSRRRLKTLDDALSLPLDALPLGEAMALLHKASRLPDHPQDAPLLERVAELCGRLPLALVIAGALVRTGGKAWTLRLLISRLTDPRPGDELAGYTDETRSLATVFDLSYHRLPEDQRLLFRRLGLLPGPEIDAYAAAALLDADVRRASLLLGRLADHSLLTGASPGRYRIHDLIRAHARTIAGNVDPPDQRHAALSRLLHYYAHTAQTASLPLARLPRPAPDGPAPAHAPDLTDPQAARDWLRTEHANLNAAFIHAHTDDLGGHAVALAAGLAEILNADGPWTHALEIHQTAATAAKQLDHPAVLATALTDLGRARRMTGNYPGATDIHLRALEIHRRTGSRLGEATALADLGYVQYLTGDFAVAADALAQALEIYRQIGDRLGEATTLTDLGQVRHQSGDFPGAADALAQALEIYRQIGHRRGEATALGDLGHVRYLTGDFPGAVDARVHVLEIYRQIGDRLGEAGALANLGHVWSATRDFPGALDAVTQALEIYRQIGSRRGEASALTELGRMRYLTGDFPGAVDALVYALEIDRQIGNRDGEAGTLTELGQARHLSGDFPGAVDALDQALGIFRGIGSRNGEAWVLTHYAATLAIGGERERAFALYRQALAMNRELNKPDDEALSLEGIGEHHLTAGDTVQGTEHLQQALEIYQRLGMHAEIERVHARLAEITPQ